MGVSVFPGTGKSNVFPVPPGAIPKATVTATTGSPNIDSSTRAGKTIFKFTGSGSITIGIAGNVEAIIVSGGGGGTAGAGFNGGGGGGAGGVLFISDLFLPSGALTVTIGAGGIRNNNDLTGLYGNISCLRKSDFNIIALPGGDSNNNARSLPGFGGFGASTAGVRGQVGSNTKTVTTIPSQQGNVGGNTSGSQGGGSGGGGSNAAGSSTSSQSGAAGGDGISNSITGSAVNYGGGGGGGSTQSGGGSGGAGGNGGGGAGGTGTAGGAGGNGTAGATNTGGGGGGAGFGSSAGTSAAGGSGVIIIVIG